MRKLPLLKRELLLGFSNMNTRRNFQADLKSMDSWFSPWRGSEGNIEALEYIRYLEKQGLRASTIRGRVIRLRKIYEFLRLKGFRKDNPIELSYAPRLKDHRTPKCPDLDELKRIFSTLDCSSFEGLRDTLAISFMFFEAFRVHEVVGLNRGDIEQVGSRLVCEVRGKGGRIDTVFLFPKTEQLVRQYLKLAEHTGPQSPLIYSLRCASQRITTRAVRKRVDFYFKKAKVRKGLSCHSLRHGAAALLAAQGFPVTGVQKRLRHASPITSLRYYYHDLEKAYPKNLANPGKMLEEYAGL
ncbi:MAG: tyrosine-type recombinase/integrase [Bdellovibrionales bacterium]|nr:tyrosine-type recombinase/integrase [Bdellovibrionales bacterium]